jgi:outer membrane autotransporter protein
MKTKKASLLGSASVLIGLAGTVSGAQAQAQCSNSLSTQTVSFDDGGRMSVTGVAASGGAAVGALVSAINSFNTVYLSQGSAFVANPPAKKEETGGGIWGRGVGGRVDTKFSTNATFSGIGGSVNCPSAVHQTYAGFQMGADVGKLNLGNSGAYVHFGITGGFGQSNFSENAPGTLTGGIESPFVGVYATYANGNFFADGMARFNSFTTTLTEPANLGLFGQRLDARGFSLQGSAGYKIDVPNSNWFVEPSAGIVYSNTTVDPLNFGGTQVFTPFPVMNGTLPGTLNINNLQSTLARFGGRIGSSFQAGNVVLQPFAAASVWHEFQGASSASISVPGIGGPPPNILSAQLSVSNVTTYGQYSIGIAGQNTDGWVSYVRVDYRKGTDIDALGINGGIRYQFMPPTVLAKPKGVYKAPVAAVVPPYNWGGFYVGGLAGASWGIDRWTMISGPNDRPPISNVVSGATSPKNAGWLAGGAIGYNFRAGDWLLGPEADVAWTQQKGASACPASLNRQSSGVLDFINNFANAPTYPVSFFQCNNDRASPIVTLTGRVGHSVMDRVMVYAKGGGAWIHDSYSISFNSPPAIATPFFSPIPGNFLVRSAADDRFGWTVGAGFEFGITQRLSTKVEYDYLDFGTKTLVFGDPLVPVTASIKETINQVKIGLNYRFAEAP